MKFDKKVNDSLKEYIINSQEDSYEVLHDCDDISEEEYNLDIAYIRKVIEKNESDFLKNNPHSAKNKNKKIKDEAFCLGKNPSSKTDVKATAEMGHNVKMFTEDIESEKDENTKKIKNKKNENKDEKNEKNTKSFKNTKDVNKTCIDEVLKISLDEGHMFWSNHCTNYSCVQTKKTINGLLKLKTNLDLCKRDKCRKRSSLKCNYRSNMKFLKEECYLFNKENYIFVRNLRPLKYNFNNIGSEDELVKNGNGIWELELNKTIVKSIELQEEANRLNILPQEVYKYKKDKRIQKNSRRTKSRRRREKGIL